MKANEAPEKIYLNPRQDALTEMLSTKVKGDIEYTHTDAFIEKALEWIRDNIRPYYHEVRYKYDDFEKYMKGEKA